MCTAATYKTKDFYFGRTLDYEFSYGDEITITPRNYPFHFRHSDKAPDSHYAIIGMAHVAGDYPLYYDAINEKGLGMAGLNFVGNAVYAEPVSDKENVAQFEFIPWILSQCATLKEARQRLSTMNLTGCSRPAMIRNVVVLPHPEDPSKVINSPLLISRLILSRTASPSVKLFFISFSSSETSANYTQLLSCKKDTSLY